MKTELSPSDTGQMLTQQTSPVGNGISHFSAALKLEHPLIKMHNINFYLHQL